MSRQLARGGLGAKMARCSEQGLPWGLVDREMPLKRCTLSFQTKFEGGGVLRTQGGEMKLDPDLHPEKKVFPWEFKWCAFMQPGVLNKNIGSMSGYLSRGGAASKKHSALSEQGTPWGPDDDETPQLLCRLDI